MQLALLDRYGSVREEALAACDSIDVADVGEDAFEGVSQRVGLFTFTVADRIRPQGEQAAVWSIDVGCRSEENKEADEVMGYLSTLPKMGKIFSDPGVHTGNMSKIVILDEPNAGKTALVREGKGIGAFLCGKPRKFLWVDPPREEGQYFRAGDRSVYVNTPILLRQTAGRPIATLHREPTYFRNSILACAGLPGVDDRVFVAILNSDLIARWYRTRHLDSGQKAFPQVKVGALCDLPMFPLENLTPALETDICAEVDTASEGAMVPGDQDGRQHPRTRLENLVQELYGLGRAACEVSDGAVAHA